jgi:hypothetical protein
MAIEFIDGFATESGETLVFLYDLATGAYCGSGFVPVSKGGGLALGQSLIRPPDVKPGFSAQWTGGAWQMVEDNRGQWFQTADGIAVEHTLLGPLPEGLTSEPKPTPWHRWEAGVWVFDEVLEQQHHLALFDELSQKVDDAANAARERLCGGQLRAAEYKLTANEAQIFRDADYPADAVPRSVAAAMTASKTARQAADEILAAAARCEEHLLRIREIRLSKNELLRTYLVDGQYMRASKLVEEAQYEFVALN